MLDSGLDLARARELHQSTRPAATGAFPSRNPGSVSNIHSRILKFELATSEKLFCAVRYSFFSDLTSHTITSKTIKPTYM